MARYGLMPTKDYDTFDQTLELVNKKFLQGVVNTLELGVHKGYTSRGIRDFFLSKGRVNFHTAIDNQRDFEMSSPFPECNFIIGSTIEIFNQIRDNSQHFIFQDACHNYPMTMADFLVYSDKVVKGGYYAFHDTSPHIKPFQDYQGSGSKEDADMFISCRKAVKKLGLLDDKFEGWKLVLDVADEKAPTGGISVFQKTK